MAIWSQIVHKIEELIVDVFLGRKNDDFGEKQHDLLVYFGNNKNEHFQKIGFSMCF